MQHLFGKNVESVIATGRDPLPCEEQLKNYCPRHNTLFLQLKLHRIKSLLFSTRQRDRTFHSCGIVIGKDGSQRQRLTIY